MLTYESVYEDRRGNRILIHSIDSPPKSRSFRVAGGKRKFRRISVKATKRKVIIVARSSKARGKKADILDEELEELEGLEDLDDLEDEEPEDIEDEEETDDEDDLEDEDEDTDEDEEESDDDLEDEEEDDFEDEEEEPAPKKRGRPKTAAKAATKPTKPSRSKTTDGKVGTAEVAEAAGVDARTLRIVLRKHGIPKDEDTSRYEWSSLDHPQVKKILKLIEQGEHKKAAAEAFDKLKARGAEQRKAKQESPARMKRKAKDIIDNGDDPEDEDDVQPAPPRPTRKGTARTRATAGRTAKASPAKTITVKATAKPPRRRRKVEDEDDE